MRGAKKSFIGMLPAILSLAFSMGIGHSADERAQIGVIRWDAWFSGSPWAKSIRTEAWKARLPFYATVDADNNIDLDELSAAAVEQEKLYAIAAGVDYFIYGLYLDVNDVGKLNPTMAKFNRAIDLFIRNSNKFMKFSVYLPHPPELETSVRLHELLYGYFKDPSFLRTADGRPVVFWLLPRGQSWIDAVGGVDAAKSSLQKFRSDVRANVGAQPYVVAMTFSPSEAPALVKSIGFDAISSYGNPLGGRSPDSPTGARPYRRCLSSSRYYWSVARASGLPFLPPVSLGWDYRPALAEQGRNKDPEWCEFPSTEEVEEAVSEGLRTTPDSAFRSIVIYAWNEFAEGGILAPTLCSGADRLRGVARATGRTAELEKALRKQPLPLSPAICVSERDR